MSSEENFASSLIESHYQTKRNQAIAFLFTVGAKALVLAEHHCQHDTYRGLDEEAEAKQEMVHEEKVRSMKKKFLEKFGVSVCKISRSGTLRKVNIRLRQYNTARGNFLIWRSKLKLRKFFKLDRTLSVQTLHITEGSNSHHEPAPLLITNGPNASKEKYNHVPLLRFQNGKRRLDIQFNSIYEVEACVQIVQQCQPACDTTRITKLCSPADP